MSDNLDFTERQKKMLFCIEGLRNRDKKLIDANPEVQPLAEELLKLFFEETDMMNIYDMFKDRTGVNI
jgi:hypothetical protein